MERRQYPRVQVPLEVELAHPLIGRRRAVARDVSADFVYVWYEDAPFKPGTTLRVTVGTGPLIDARPTPTVRMEVVRVDQDGFAMRFANASSAHLWRSTEREAPLEVGRDLFRVAQAAVVRAPDGRVLAVQRRGRWVFPGSFLRVGKDWRDALQYHLRAELNLEVEFVRTVMIDSGPDAVALESTTLTLVHLFEAASTAVRLRERGTYAKHRWLESARHVDTMSFASERLRSLALDCLGHGREDVTPPAAPRRRANG